MRKIKENEIIISAGQKNNRLYKIVSGSFAIYINYGLSDEYLLGVLSTGKCFGEIGFLTGEESPYTVIANEDSAVFEFTQDNFQSFIVQNPRNVIDIMKSMALRVNLLQKHIELLMRELNDDIDKKDRLNKDLQNNLKKYSRITPDLFI